LIIDWMNHATDSRLPQNSKHPNLKCRDGPVRSRARAEPVGCNHGQRPAVTAGALTMARSPSIR
jgi:hypothetical protein